MPLSDSLQSGGDVEGLAFDKRDHRFLDVLLATADTLEPLGLALAEKRVDSLDLDTEERFDSGLDLSLAGVAGDVEDDLVILGNHGRLFSDDRRPDHIVMAKIRHLNRSSRA